MGETAYDRAVDTCDIPAPRAWGVAIIGHDRPVLESCFYTMRGRHADMEGMLEWYGYRRRVPLGEILTREQAIARWREKMLKKAEQTRGTVSRYLELAQMEPVEARPSFHEKIQR